jgi:CubicO group peptidase (beta-lactamase class C family)
MSQTPSKAPRAARTWRGPGSARARRSSGILRCLPLAALAAFAAAPAAAQRGPRRGVPVPQAARMCPTASFTVGTGGIMEDPAVAAAVRGVPAIVEANRQAGQHTSIAIAVVHGGQTLLSGGIGCANLEQRRPATADTVYRIGSVTKVFQATWLMQLRDAGKVDLDQPVDRSVPAVWFLDPSGQRVSPTWKQLASHTAGLQDQMPTGLETSGDLFRWLESDRALYPPGSRYAYSDIGYVTLGQALASANGVEYHEAIRKGILEPLGMSSSTYAVEAVPKETLATGYRREGRKPGLFPAGFHNPFPPSGTLLSTANDMARFLMLYLGRRHDGVLSSATRREMFAKIAPIGQGPGYVGIGWFMRPSDQGLIVAKNGGQPGFTTLLQMLPEWNLGVVALINESPKLVSREHEGEAILLRQVFDAVAPAVRAASAMWRPGVALAGSLAGRFSARSDHAERLAM